MFKCVALVGATGAVGRIMRQLLESRHLPVERYRFLASARSAGSTITFQGKPIVVEELTKQAFAGCDLVIATTPDDIARDFLPAAVEAGATVIDESGYWRMDKNVPLVIPEINPQEALKIKAGIISSPNCSTTQMALALKPLHDYGKVKRVVVSTYQATSGIGVQGQKELIEGTAAALKGESYNYTAFKHPIAFNCIPQIGGHKEDGYTSEEMKMVYETRKILGDESIMVCPTAVRIPVSNCHSESIMVETERPISPEKARELFASFPGIKVVDDLHNSQYPLPSTSDGCDLVYVGRIRKDISHPNETPIQLTSAAVERLAALDAADGILAAWGTLSPIARREAQPVLTSRAGTALTLLKAVEAKQIPASDLDAATRTALTQSPDGRIASLAKTLLMTSGSSTRQAVIEKFKPALELTGDDVHGRMLFEKKCATCHKHREIGNQIGPQLSALTNKSGDFLIRAILDPNQAIESKYTGYVATTKDGRVFTGMITDETATSLTLAKADGKKDTLLRVDLDELRSTGKSFMPEGLELEISPQDLADIFKFVQGQ